MRLHEKTGSIKHFIEYFYLISDSIKQTFLGHLLCTRHRVHHETSSGCVASTLQTWHSSASSFPVAKGKSWLLFIYLSWSFLIWSTTTNIKGRGIFTEAFHAVRSLRFSQQWERKLEILKTWVYRGNPSTVQSGAGGNGERAQEGEPPHLPNFSHTLVISQNING